MTERIEFSVSAVELLLCAWRYACKRNSSGSWSTCFWFATDALATCPPEWSDDVAMLRDISRIHHDNAPDVGDCKLPSNVSA